MDNIVKDLHIVLLAFILSNYFSFYLASAVTYAPKAIFCMHLAVTNRPKFLKNGKVIMINPFIAEFTKRYIVFLAAVLKYLNIRKTGGWQWETLKLISLSSKSIDDSFLPLEYKTRSN